MRSMVVREGDSVGVEARYDNLQLLGRGGMGEVWKAFDTILDRWVALKLCKPVDPISERLFEREARLAASLNHPNIGSIYDITTVNGFAAISMQFIEGKSLSQLEGLTPVRIAEIVRDAARGVAHAHKEGVIHRDLSPHNLMVTNDCQVLVIDFGLSCRKGDDLLKGQAVGTPRYISPWQASGGIPTELDDVFSLGQILYHKIRPLHASHPLLAIASKATAVDERL